MLREIIDNIRSGLSFKLLSLAIDVAPERERLSLAAAAHEHCMRSIAMDGQQEARRRKEAA